MNWNARSDDEKWRLTAQSFDAYFESAAGLAMYQRYWAAINAADYDVAFGCHYHSQGEWVENTRSFTHWGLRDVRNVDTLRSAWWKTQ